MHCLEATSGKRLMHRKGAFLISGELNLRFPLLGCLFLHTPMHVGAVQHVMKLHVVWLSLAPQASLAYCCVKLARMNQGHSECIRTDKGIEFHSLLLLLESLVRSLQSLENQSTYVARFGKMRV